MRRALALVLLLTAALGAQPARSFTIHTDPPGATVWDSWGYLGQSDQPLKIPLRAAGPVVVLTFKCKGYRSFVLTVSERDMWTGDYHGGTIFLEPNTNWTWFTSQLRRQPLVVGLWAAGAGTVLFCLYTLRRTRQLEQTLTVVSERKVEPLLGRRLGAWTLTRQIGSAAYEASPEAIVKVSEAEPAAAARLVREFRLAASLDHPGLPKMLDAGVDNSLVWVALEKVQGRALDGLPPLEVARAMQQVLAAVGYLHARGLVHRNLKPSKIRVLADGSGKLTDLGLLKRGDGLPGITQQVPLGQKAVVMGHDEMELTRADWWQGTLDFLAPEQLRGGPATPLTDQYSLGICMYLALGGTPCKQGLAERLMQGVQLVPLECGELAAVVARMTAADPTARYPDLLECLPHA